MPYFLRIHGGIGIHAGYLPGHPASHGCIRLPEKMVLQFFQNAAVGTPVEIRHASAPYYVLSPWCPSTSSSYQTVKPSVEKLTTASARSAATPRVRVMR
jgi:L,D-transpeptidase catalytic domain